MREQSQAAGSYLGGVPYLVGKVVTADTLGVPYRQEGLLHNICRGGGGGEHSNNDNFSSLHALQSRDGG